jgi:hypothetical protein
MSLAVVLSRGLAGLEAPLVTVEVHLAGGLPAFNLVGLPDTEVKESRDRVRAALQNAQFVMPARKIAVQSLYSRRAEALRGARFIARRCAERTERTFVYAAVRPIV